MISASFLSMLYVNCTSEQPYVTCNAEKGLPMVSSLIRLPRWDKVACLTFKFFMLAVQQVNVRAVYKAMYGITPNSSNDYLLILGFIYCLSLPLVSIFDSKDFKFLHVVLQVHSSCQAVFISTGFQQRFKGTEINFQEWLHK